MQIAEPPIDIGELTEQERAAIPKTRVVPAELMSRVRLCHRCGPRRYEITHQQLQSLSAPQPLRVKAELNGQRFIEHEQTWVSGLLGLPRKCHLRELSGKTIPQDYRLRGCNSHALESTHDRYRPLVTSDSPRRGTAMTPLGLVLVGGASGFARQSLGPAPPADLLSTSLL